MGANLAGRPAILWNARISAGDPGFGLSPAGFGFTATGGIGWPFIVETCTNLTNPVWQPASTNIMVNGVSSFTDPAPSQHPAKYYRLRTP